MRALSLVLLLVLAACAKPVAPTVAGNYKTIGVASTLGRTVTLKEVGLTVFGNSESNLDSDAWGIDDAIARETARLLARRYDARAVPLDPAALGKTHFPGEGSIFGSSRPVGEALRDVLGGQGLDAYVLVVPRAAKLGTSNQWLGGLGLLKAYGGAFGLRGSDYDLYALYYVSVFDGKTFELIGDARAPSRGFHAGDPRPAPHRRRGLVAGARRRPQPSPAATAPRRARRPRARNLAGDAARAEPRRLRQAENARRAAAPRVGDPPHGAERRGSCGARGVDRAWARRFGTARSPRAFPRRRCAIARSRARRALRGFAAIPASRDSTPRAG
jgi:hypothetical protein